MSDPADYEARLLTGGAFRVDCPDPEDCNQGVPCGLRVISPPSSEASE